MQDAERCAARVTVRALSSRASGSGPSREKLPFRVVGLIRFCLAGNLLPRTTSQTGGKSHQETKPREAEAFHTCAFHASSWQQALPVSLLPSCLFPPGLGHVCRSNIQQVTTMWETTTGSRISNHPTLQIRCCRKSLTKSPRVRHQCKVLTHGYAPTPFPSTSPSVPAHVGRVCVDGAVGVACGAEAGACVQWAELQEMPVETWWSARVRGSPPASDE